jgi:predicted RNA-binding Zn-ribbon protein involved in translation (DUF1610 family)
MEDFVTIATYLSLAEAEPHRLALEAAGISTLDTDESVGSLLGSNLVGGIKLQVAAKDVEAAKEVLATLEVEAQANAEATEADESDDDVCLACPKCGAEVCFPSERRGHVEECPECGGYVDVPELNEPE